MVHIVIGIDPAMKSLDLKSISDVLKPFTYICNQSFLEGIFPEQVKTAKVIPLFKSGDKCLFTNYLPVSLLPQFSKIMENCFVIG